VYCIEVKSTGRIPILKLNDGLEVAKFFLISYLINKFDFLFSKIFLSKSTMFEITIIISKIPIIIS
jgi:hypothetical protein